MKYALLTATLFLSSMAFAQYNKPIDVSYDYGTNTYYIAEQGTGKILSIKNGTATTFASGLTKPNAVAFGTLPLGSGVLVGDSNVLKAYMASGSFLTNITLPGAMEIGDVTGDIKTNALYVSDVKRNYIYKITFGGPPFYLPNVTNFITSGLNKPSSIYFDTASNKLLVVSDIANTPIVRIDPSTKKMDTAMTTTISNAAGIEKDAQGNYYLTSWNDNYLYQVDKNFSGSKQMYFYNNPAKLWYDPNTDLLNFTCYNCGKLEQIKIHSFAPEYDVEICHDDSFKIYSNSFVKDWGCYDKNNKFIVQLSDRNQSFSNPVDLVSIQDTSIPALFRGKLPVGVGSGTYSYRIVSTNPYTESILTKQFVVKAIPDGLAYATDTAFYCKTDSVKLGATPSAAVANLEFEWTPNSYLSDDDVAYPYSKTPSVATYQLKTTHKTTGCVAHDSVVVVPLSNPPSNFRDTVVACKGSVVELGVSENPAFDYQWTPGNDLNDSNSSNPKIEAQANGLFYVEVSSGACFTKDSVYLKVNPIPELTGWKDSFWKCKDKAIVLGGDPNTSVEYKWTPPSGINKDNVSNPECFEQQDKVYELTIEDKITGCKKDYRTTVLIIPAPAKPVVSKTNDSTLISSTTGDSFVWYKDGVVLSNSNKREWVAKEDGMYKVQVFNQDGCSSLSDEFEFKKSNSVWDLLGMAGVQVYPNPITNVLRVNTAQYWSGQLVDANGRLYWDGVQQGSAALDVALLPKGVYLFHLTIENKHFTLKLVK